MDDEIRATEKQLNDARRRREAEPVRDYQFRTGDGSAALSDLFGPKDDLLIIHNMGAGCAYCSLWADGLNGLQPLIENRASFVVVSPDAPAAQAKFAAGREWKFRMVFEDGTGFTNDMGFLTEGGGHYPGSTAWAG